MTNPPFVSIIIVQYNNSQDTIRCLESVKELDYPNFEIIIMDNASEVKHLNSIRFFIENQSRSDFSASRPRPSAVADSGLGFTLHASRFNSGYAGGNNVGIRNALKHGTDYVLILNPDTVVAKDLLTKLVDAGEASPKVGILGPVINENGHFVYGGQIEWLKPELNHNEVKPTTYLPRRQAGNLQPTTYLIGACMLIKKSVIKKMGLFDERYFLYFEDADYCLRAQKAGYELKIVTETKIDHATSASTSHLGSALLLRYHFRNAHLFNLKNDPWYIKLALPFWSFFIIIKQIIKIVLGQNKEISKAILSGVIDFYKGRFGQIS